MVLLLAERKVYPMNQNRVPILLTVGLAMLIATASIAAATPRPPAIDAANFVSGVDNPFFPLPPGTTFHYRGNENGVAMRDEMFVTRDTKQILGVNVTVVHDQVFEGRVLTED